MLFVWVLGVAPLLLGPHGTDSAFSRCQILDLELARARRIQAVRGQILSKLQLETPPEEEGAPRPLPPEGMLLYNSAREKVRRLVDSEGRRRAWREEEEYYANEVKRVAMLTLGHGDNSIPGPFSTPFFRFLHFDLSVAPPNISNLLRAELRIYKIPNPGSHATPEQHVELYQVMHAGETSAPIQYYVGSRMLPSQPRPEWVSFDVTESVRRCLRNRGKKLSFRLGLHCPCCTSTPAWNTINSQQHLEPLEALFTGLDDDLIKAAWRGWSGSPDLSRNAPHLIFTSGGPKQPDPAPKVRHPRAARAPSCPRNKDCCRHPLYIDFRKDLKWKWIHQPKGYKANFCVGGCRYTLATDMRHNMGLPQYGRTNPEGSASPCCVAHKLEPLTILYYVGRQPKVQQLSNMIVKSCRCR